MTQRRTRPMSLAGDLLDDRFHAFAGERSAQAFHNDGFDLRFHVDYGTDQVGYEPAFLLGYNLLGVGYFDCDYCSTPLLGAEFNMPVAIASIKDSKLASLNCEPLVSQSWWRSSIC